MSQHVGARIRRRVMRTGQFVLILCTILFAADAAAAVPIVDLGTLGGIFSSAFAVNASGQVVGLSDTAEGQFHAFSWTPGREMIDLGTLGGSSSLVVALVVAPAQVQAHAVGRDVAERVVQRLDVALGDLHELRVAELGKRDVTPHREVRAIDLQPPP